MILGGAASAATLQVTITNAQGAGGLYLTPLFVAFQDGSFDAFNAGSAASANVELLAETGNPSGLVSDAMAAGAVAGVITSPGGFPGAPVIDPGETASMQFDVDTSSAVFFSFMSMIIPSNDLFIGNDDPMAYQVFDAAGVFVNPGVINIYGGSVWDAGTEVNDNLGAAFNAAGGTATDEGGVIGLAGDLSFLIGEATAAGTTIFSVPRDRELLASITIGVVPVPAALPLFLAGLGAFGFIARRRKVS